MFGTTGPRGQRFSPEHPEAASDGPHILIRLWGMLTSSIGWTPTVDKSTGSGFTRRQSSLVNHITYQPRRTSSISSFTALSFEAVYQNPRNLPGARSYSV